MQLPKQLQMIKLRLNWSRLLFDRSRPSVRSRANANISMKQPKESDSILYLLHGFQVILIKQQYFLFKYSYEK
jgi:hypothetical protein